MPACYSPSGARFLCNEPMPKVATGAEGEAFQKLLACQGRRCSGDTGSCAGAGAPTCMFEQREMEVLSLVPPGDESAIAAVATGLLAIPRGVCVELRGCVTFHEVHFEGACSF